MELSLLTLQKFEEETDLLSKRGNNIAITGEAHRSYYSIDPMTKSNSFAIYFMASIIQITKA